MSKPTILLTPGPTPVPEVTRKLMAEFRRATADILPLKQQTTMILKPVGFSPIR